MPDIAELKNKKTDLVAMKPKDQVKHLLEQNKLAIAQAMPRHMNPDRLLKVAQTAVTTTPALLECYLPTLLGGIIQCSQMGLEPNTVLGHAYLIPFQNKKKNRKEVQVLVGYKGLIDLARRSGQIESIAAHAVRKGDLFEYEYGLTEKLRHIPTESDRGEITHFYAVAHMKDGGHAFEVMTRKQVEKIRDGGNRNPVWSEHFEEMGRKTAIRRLAKYLPLSVEFATSVAQDGQMAPSLESDGSLTGEFNLVEEDDGNADDVGGAKGIAGGGNAGGATEIRAEGVGEGGQDQASNAPSPLAPPETPMAAQVIEKIRSLKTVDALDVFIDAFNGAGYSEADRTKISRAYSNRREVLEEGPQESKPRREME